MHSVETLGIMRGGVTQPSLTRHNLAHTYNTIHGVVGIIVTGHHCCCHWSSESTNCGDIEVQGGRAQLLLLTYCR